MTSQVEVPPLTGLIHFISGKRRVNNIKYCVRQAFANSGDPDQNAPPDQDLHGLPYFNVSWICVQPTTHCSATFLELHTDSTSLIA